MVTVLEKKNYTFDLFCDDVRTLVRQGKVDRQEPIYKLCRYIPERDWECVQIDLEEHEFLLRDRIIDLLSNEIWQDD